MVDPVATTHGNRLKLLRRGFVEVRAEIEMKVLGTVAWLGDDCVAYF